mmetsp:Transcript_30268/g.29767  ORF Transcript_30268/g.29767 Transcript_30268/m.29767 type:complete len:157 (-) Transcript_30268:81-551(-)
MKLPSLLESGCSLDLSLKISKHDYKILRSVPNNVKINSLSLIIPNTLYSGYGDTDVLIDQFSTLLDTKRLVKLTIDNLQSLNTTFLMRFIEFYFTERGNKLTELVIQGEPDLFELVLNDSTKNAYTLTLKPLKNDFLKLSTEDKKLKNLKHRRIVF